MTNTDRAGRKGQQRERAPSASVSSPGSDSSGTSPFPDRGGRGGTTRSGESEPPAPDRAVVPEWLSLRDIAEAIGFDKSTVRRWIVEHRVMPYGLFGPPGVAAKQIRVRRSDFEAWLAARVAEAEVESVEDYLQPGVER